MRRPLLALLLAGCDAGPPSGPVPYAEADPKPVAVGGWGAFAATVEYPEFASRARIEGDVATAFVVTADGEAGDVTIAESPNDLLSEAAVHAVRAAAYVPGEVAGRRVDVRTTLCVAFRLGDGITAAPCER